MALTRRDFLRLAGAAAAGVATLGCTPVYDYLAGQDGVPDGLPNLTTHQFEVLRRLTFGPTPAERTRAVELGLAGWVEEQLSPESIEDRRAAWRLRALDILGLNASELADLGDGLFDSVDPQPVLGAFRRATLLRQIYSRRQLSEMMVAFWTDHFNIAVSKGDCWFLKVVDDREVIRRHALGNFRDLVRASAKSPAMLVYLDNQANHRDRPNENYARELLELHTLGVNGGYTQADVMELARCLSGWSVKEHFWRGQFKFDEDHHDQGAKRVLSTTVEAGDMAETAQVLDTVALHPATARRLAEKLARRFVADDPMVAAPDVVDRAARAFLKSGGEIKAMLRVIIFEGVVYAGGPLSPKFKRPNDYVVSAMRQLCASSDGGEDLHGFLAMMGQPLYDWPTPDGPPDVADAWHTNLMPRWQFATRLVFGEIAGSRVDLGNLLGGVVSAEAILARLGALLLGQRPLADAASGLLGVMDDAELADPEDVGALIAAALLASPAFQWR